MAQKLYTLGPVRRRRVILTAVLVALALAGWAVGAMVLKLGFWYRPPSSRYHTIGIDVSHHNGRIDWRAVASTEVRFAYLKSTEGTDWVDSRFTENWARAREAGLVTGAYHFFSFCSSGSAQAEHFLATLPTTGDMLSPALDVELGGSCRNPPAASVVHDEVLSFLKVVETRLGTKPVLYITAAAFEAYFNPDEFETIAGPGAARLWYRSVFEEPRLKYPMAWTFWQYHPRGRVDGIEGPVDLNAFVASADQLPIVHR